MREQRARVHRLVTFFAWGRRAFAISENVEEPPYAAAMAAARLPSHCVRTMSSCML
jgi:hypothetical protein